jgi:hypothetical protein
MEKQLVLLREQQKRKFFTSCFSISEQTHPTKPFPYLLISALRRRRVQGGAEQKLKGNGFVGGLPRKASGRVKSFVSCWARS